MLEKNVGVTTTVLEIKCLSWIIKIAETKNEHIFLKQLNYYKFKY